MKPLSFAAACSKSTAAKRMGPGCGVCGVCGVCGGFGRRGDGTFGIGSDEIVAVIVFW